MQSIQEGVRMTRNLEDAQQRAVQGALASEHAGGGRARIAAIDQLRGLVIVLMALDHVRDYFSGAQFSPTDLSKTDAALFMTRWITHFCAPSFVFLAGTSAYLLSRHKTRAETSRFLLSRGLWLVVLEFSVVNFVWTFNLDYRGGLTMQVIWVIGASMCLLASLVWLPSWAVGALGALLVAGHNLTDSITPAAFGSWAPLWNVLHVRGQIPIGVVIYPLVPWLGVMALGYAFGRVYELEERARQRSMLALGAALCLLFAAVRALNGYGDPAPWSAQARAGFTLLSFLNVTKYPPSLDYTAMTLGPALLLLAAFEHTRGPLARALATLGRVPLFAYVVHLALAHLLAGLTSLALGQGKTVLTNLFVAFPEDWGFDLGGVYLAWLCVLALLYPACHWFAGLKRRRHDWWLAYL
jgi:uncharacterized membrane protein